MIYFIGVRIIQSTLVLVSVAFLSFCLTVFSDPVAGIAGPSAPDELRQRIRAELRLDDPFLVRYVRFVGDAVKGDFGLSYATGQPVTSVVAKRIPATSELSLVAVILSLVIGVPSGLFIALRRRSWFTQFLMTISLVGMSVPTFVLGIGLISAFAVAFGWLPAYGRGQVVMIGNWPSGLLTASGLKSVIMPGLALAIPNATLIMRLVRAEMLETLRTDHIRFARARGLSPVIINLRYALRNTLAPIITIVGLQIGSLLSFAIVTEVVFQWPGLGALFMQSIQKGDIPVISTLLLMVALCFVVISLVVDVLYTVIDPRLRTGSPSIGAATKG